MSNEYFTKTGYPSTGAAGSSASMRSEIADIEAGFDKLPALSGNGSKVIAVNSGGSALEAIAVTGSGSAVLATSPTLVTPALGTPSSGTLTNCTGLPVAGGGTGRSTGTTAYALIATGTTATGAQQTLASGATTEILVGGGASALPVWTTAQGSGAPVRATSPTLTSPTLTTPSLGVATATSINGLAITTTTGTLTVTNGKTLSVGNTLTLTGTDETNLNINAVATLNHGTYTPTRTNGANVTASSDDGNGAQWMRVGNVVTVSGAIDLSTTGAGTTAVQLSLPVASNFYALGTAAGDCVGSCCFVSTPPVFGYVSNANSTTATCYFEAAGASGVQLKLRYHFTYVVK